jgi:hypothetical protein
LNCERCGNEGAMHKLGTRFSDKFFPKTLCDNCDNEWRKALYKQKFWEYYSGKLRDDKFDVMLMNFFKKWFENGEKIKVMFT